MNTGLYYTLLFFFISWSVDGQMAREVAELPDLPWHEHQWVAKLSVEEKVDRLKTLPAGDSVQYESPWYSADYPEDARYLPLDTAGLRFTDLNGDGKLDLLYSGSSGAMGKRDTKVYYLENGRYEYHRELPGTVIHMNKDKEDNLVVYTHWKPCCDSYTSRIEKYLFSPSKKGEYGSSISVIGRLTEYIKIKVTEQENDVAELYPIPIRAMKDFSKLRKGKLGSVDLVAFWSDFRGTSPYFRERNQEIRSLLRNRQPIHLLTLEAQVDVRIIAEKIHNNERWFLVLTDAMNDVPKSLYEWSAGSQRQFVGWVQDVDLYE